MKGVGLKRSLLAAALAVFAAAAVLPAAAQDADSVLLTYQRNFVRSSLGAKLELLKEAGARKAAEMAPLYETALRFAIENVPLLGGSDAQLRELALVAATKVGEARYPRAADRLWSLFNLYEGDTELRAAAIRAIGAAGSADAAIVARLGEFLAAQNMLFRTGILPEYPALEATVEALGALGDGSSFPVLFSTYLAGYSPALTAKASAALGRIKGDYAGYLARVLVMSSPLEKAAALKAGLENPSFGPEERGALAEAALAAGLEWQGGAPVEAAAIRALNLRAIGTITELRWQRASPLVLRYFRAILADYGKGVAPREALVETIACLGSMGSTEAAQALALQLQLINAQTELGGSYEEELIVAVVNALGELGDKVAFDYLLYVGYLRYPDAVKRAAKDALQRLKW